jgi:hypothetical protein
MSNLNPPAKHPAHHLGSLLTDKLVETANVRFWHKADIARLSSNVRLWGKADITRMRSNVRL